MRLVYRLAKGVTAKEARAALNQIPELDAASQSFWNWLGQKKAQRDKHNADQSHGLEFVALCFLLSEHFLAAISQGEGRKPADIQSIIGEPDTEKDIPGPGSLISTISNE